MIGFEIHMSFHMSCWNTSLQPPIASTPDTTTHLLSSTRLVYISESCKWKYKVGSISFSITSWDSSMLVHTSISHSFYCWSAYPLHFKAYPLHGYAIDCLSIYLLEDIWIVSSFWKLYMKLWTLMYKSSSMDIFSCPNGHKDL